MKLHSASLAALSLAIALGLSACGGDKQAAQQPAADGAAAPAAAGDKVTAEVSGAGASFIFPLVSKWSADYNTATGAKINYQSIGSGGGIAQIKAGTVDFGSSDKPLSSDELAQAGLAQFPSAIGGVVPVVNIDGLEAGKLRLSGALLADIFLGKVKTWNDPAIVAANPGVTLPDGKITIVHRSDGSGTTFNFSNYLSKVNPEWKSKVGEGTSVQWPDGVGGKGNEGVASYVKQIKGSIGYVELAYALQNAMPYASLQNAAGTWVQPNAETFAAAAASADWASAKDFNLVITNAPGEQAWPITATNFMLMQKKPKDAKRNQDALAFFKWAFESGQTQANELHYVPLPAELVKQIEAYWATELK
ncbi:MULTISPECIES: phosphate ABC transporter substrate-binding protein PstS [Stenotrophomonas]|jgi:phosphate transport system substrate-binding protein|uniref:phosphate ABC transporter substrate-binding protein PstS n=1 Tax=Stenotrophomonas TaxID=40323 RepID=UPI000C180A61|nr:MULTISPECIES: phosphate ABC transporter substrate-binding protein PstS [Stenotrophomonas]MCO7469007.1 phosphate ABC transporter substrate-binding protein PstS [Stenotrophomonas maltophilia]PII19653.1 phosphate ABC transporter substrate-binding protein PstS [Stenotrophomonas sp. LMG 10879]PJO51507.1 phosphate ABC transporter substrate-binding protein PstS [Stenotrophomonas lactitubi]QII28486.1 phosphate ABC transporter substrate-binding protein PstS [Stenotrophomonas maltophilia]CAH0147759.1